MAKQNERRWEIVPIESGRKTEKNPQMRVAANALVFNRAACEEIALSGIAGEMADLFFDGESFMVRRGDSFKIPSYTGMQKQICMRSLVDHFNNVKAETGCDLYSVTHGTESVILKPIK